jgi:PAS domain S-box-containing protein
MNATSGSPRGFFGGIRLYLVGLALLVALPLAALSLLRIVTQREHARHMANEEAVRLARLVAARADERIRTADALLLGLSAELTPDPARRTRSDSVLARVLQVARGRYANVFLVDSTGTLTGSGRRMPAGLDTVGAVRDRSYFVRARTATSYVVGEPIRSRVANDSAWIVVLARPVRDGQGRFLGAVGVSILLDSLADVVSTANLPGRPLVTIFDSAGYVITRSIAADRYRGPPRFHVPRMPDSASVMRLKDFDGNMRVTGFTRVESAPWVANVGLLEEEAAAAMRDQLLDDLLLFGGAVGLALFVAYLISQRITRPLTRLTEDARALTRGVSGHRAVAGGPREIRSLGEAFNQMADTVERRNAALADSERRYRLLFDSNPLPMWAWDAETRVLLAVNEAAIDKYGYDRDAFLRLEITDLLDPSERTRFDASRLPFSEARQGAGVWKHRTADGRTIEMEVVTTSSRRLGRASWLSVGIDVTARRAAERALAASEEQLRQSQKMEAIGAFAGGIAHDFNNLLTGMLGYCDLALGATEPAQESYADIEEIRTLALRGAELTRQILAVSRKQVVQPAYIDPNDVVRGLNRLLRRVIGEHITFQAILGEDIGSVYADAGQLEQVLLNLAANARDAMPKGGTLEIMTGILEPQVASGYGMSPDARWVAISVRDTGTGMSEEVRQRVFEPFFTTKERGKGTGLGLALAYAMMDQAGGAIRVESAPGQGATFHLLLPRHSRPAVRREDHATSVTELRGTETILVAEDEDSVRAVATAALASRGYNVLAAPDGESALALARQYPQRIDLLLTDVVMPGMNGRELAEAMTAERDDLRVLFASGYTDDASLLAGIHTDELSFLQKPFTPAELVRRVRSLLDAGVKVG